MSKSTQPARTSLTEVKHGSRVFKIGQRRSYSRSAGYSGSGQIVDIFPTKKGPYVTIFDKVRGKGVSVRPSEVS